MFAEIDFQVAAQHHQAELLAAAHNRRLARISAQRPQEPVPARGWLQGLLRRIAGAPTFA